MLLVRRLLRHINIAWPFIVCGAMVLSGLFLMHTLWNTDSYQQDHDLNTLQYATYETAGLLSDYRKLMDKTQYSFAFEEALFTELEERNQKITKLLSVLDFSTKQKFAAYQQDVLSILEISQDFLPKFSSLYQAISHSYDKFSEIELQIRPEINTNTYIAFVISRLYGDLSAKRLLVNKDSDRLDIVDNIEKLRKLAPNYQDSRLENQLYLLAQKSEDIVKKLRIIDLIKQSFNRTVQEHHAPQLQQMLQSFTDHKEDLISRYHRSVKILYLHTISMVICGLFVIIRIIQHLRELNEQKKQLQQARRNSQTTLERARIYFENAVQYRAQLLQEFFTSVHNHLSIVLSHLQGISSNKEENTEQSAENVIYNSHNALQRGISFQQWLTFYHDIYCNKKPDAIEGITNWSETIENVLDNAGYSLSAHKIDFAFYSDDYTQELQISPEYMHGILMSAIYLAIEWSLRGSRQISCEFLIITHEYGENLLVTLQLYDMADQIADCKLWLSNSYQQSSPETEYFNMHALILYLRNLIAMRDGHIDVSPSDNDLILKIIIPITDNQQQVIEQTDNPEETQEEGDETPTAPAEAPQSDEQDDIATIEPPPLEGRVMIVSHLKRNANSLKRMLQGWGLETDIIADARSALGYIVEYDNRNQLVRPKYQIVIIDIENESFDVNQWHALMNSLLPSTFIKILLLTSIRGYSETITKAKNYGDGLLHQPLLPTKLRKKIEHLLAEHYEDYQAAHSIELDPSQETEEKDIPDDKTKKTA